MNHITAVKDAGSKTPAPDCGVGVGNSGTLKKCALMQACPYKRLRRNPIPMSESLKRMLDTDQSLGIGPGRPGGSVTALGVKH